MLGRHFSQCLWRAINASGGHGLIAHQAALVGHLVCATQHLVLLVWCGCACGDSHSQDHSANPSHCSLHTSMSSSRAHVLALSTIGDPTQNFRRYSTSVCHRSFYLFRGPPSNRWLWSMISRSSAKSHGSNRDPSQSRLYRLQRAVEHARPPELVLDRGDAGFSGLQDRFHPLLARVDRARDRIPLRRVQGRVCRHGSPATEIYAIHKRGIPGRPWSSLLMESLLIRCLVLLLSLALANGNPRVAGSFGACQPANTSLSVITTVSVAGVRADRFFRRFP